MTTPSVRFFTSASLRPHEEVPGEVVQWLPRWITVEYDRDRPVSGVWQSTTGERRICWYGEAASPDLVSAHLERYGDEPFWVIDVCDADLGSVHVTECDATGQVFALRTWQFDLAQMPMSVEEEAPDGTLRSARTFRSLSDRTVVASTEQRTGGPIVEIPRPIDFPCSELAAEPYPCGGTITTDGPRLVASISQNWFQGRLHAIYHDGAAWKLGLATIATSRGWPASMRPVLDFQADGIAPMVTYGELREPRHQGYTVFGVVEELPDGRTLEEVVSKQTLSPSEACSLALQIAEPVRKAHAAGHELSGIRPELVYVRRGGTGVDLSAIAHRGQAVIDATYCGEAVCSPPVFPANFSSRNDTKGLAQLIWFALTGGHPFVAPHEFGERKAWRELEYGKARQQPWTGPEIFGPLLERVMFESGDSPDFEAFVEELVRIRAATGE